MFSIIRRGAHLIDPFDLQRDLIQLHDFDLELAAATRDDRVANTLAQRFHRDVNVGREILRVERSADRRRWVASFQDADDFVVVGAFGNVDAFAEWFFVGKQPLGNSGRNDTDIGGGQPIGVTEKAAATFANLQVIDFGISGRAADQSAIDDAIAVGELPANLANRNRGLNRRHGGQDLFQIAAQQAVLRGSRARQFLFRRLLAADDDRVGTERFDLLLNLFAGPLADRGQHNHRPDTDHDAQHRQTRAQRVQRETLDSQLPCS